MKELKTPTDVLVKKYAHKVNSIEQYVVGDKLLSQLLQHFPENKTLESVWSKVIIVNALYSTGILAHWKIANHIVRLANLDKKFAVGDLSVVDEIRKRHGIRARKSQRERDFYSFATKYCSEHNKNAYPIFDRYVEGMLMLYRKNFLPSLRRNELRDYKRFVEVIHTFKKYYGLRESSVRQIDWFLWLYGKDFLG